VKLADGSSWDITAGDGQASFIVSHFIESLQLQPVHRPTHRLHVQVDNLKAVLRTHNGPFNWVVLPSENKEDPIVCIFKTAKNEDTLALQLMLLSLVICFHAQTHGGILLHGALAEREGYGVILAGSGGTGKTTASLRLAPPWRSLCDDLALVVRDQQGIYWAHPWPTWSKFMFGGQGGTWDVQHAVPLKGIFFLNQSRKDQVKPVRNGQAVCLLVGSTEQAWR
jgi:SynChlorMet cassette protein ScmC